MWHGQVWKFQIPVNSTDQAVLIGLVGLRCPCSLTKWRRLGHCAGTRAIEVVRSRCCTNKFRGTTRLIHQTYKWTLSEQRWNGTHHGCKVIPVANLRCKIPYMSITEMSWIHVNVHEGDGFLKVPNCSITSLWLEMHRICKNPWAVLGRLSCHTHA